MLDRAWCLRVCVPETLYSRRLVEQYPLTKHHIDDMYGRGATELDVEYKYGKNKHGKSSA